MCDLVGHHDVLWCLDDLKGKRYVGHTWHAGQITLRQRIGRRALLVVLFPLCQGRGLVRNVAALHDARPGGHAVLSRVRFEVPMGRTEHLPDAVQIRLAVGRPGARIRSGRALPRLRGQPREPDPEPGKSRRHHQRGQQALPQSAHRPSPPRHYRTTGGEVRVLGAAEGLVLRCGCSEAQQCVQRS